MLKSPMTTQTLLRAMKLSALSALTIAVLLGTQEGNAQTTEKVISEQLVSLSVEINPQKLKLSRADYSIPVVKALVPELADVTILDHRNTSEGAPCLATYQAKTPDEVIQGMPATEVVPFKITLIKQVIASPETKTCRVFLIEDVEGIIRGFKFEHRRVQEVAKRVLDDCR